MLFKAAGLSSGIDLRFIELAKARNLPIADLENAEYHAKLGGEISYFGSTEGILSDLVQMSDPKVELLFEGLVQRCKKEVGHFGRMWEFGLIEEWEQFEKKGKGTPIEQDMRKKRNKEMVVHMDLLISNDKKPFSVIRANHQFGDDSTLKILQRDFGYKVEQLVHEEVDLKALREMKQRIGF